MDADWASQRLEVGYVIQLKQTFLNNKVFHYTFSHSLTYMYVCTKDYAREYTTITALIYIYKVSPMQMGRRQMDAAAASAL